jgi:hypothetical protein
MSFTPEIWNTMVAMAEETFYSKHEPALPPLYLVLKNSYGQLNLYKFGVGFVKGFGDREELHRWLVENVEEPLEARH